MSDVADNNCDTIRYDIRVYRGLES